MNSCVNTKSAAFQQMAKDYDVSVNQLELLAHEYNMIQAEKTGAEDASAFLTDKGKEWIREKLDGQIISVGPEALKLWAERYSIPMVFSDKNAANAEYNKAKEIFGNGAVLTERNDGKQVLTVSHPYNMEYEKELTAILDSAPRNEQGQLLVRPNGPISNLTPRQYAQVRTKAFKDWFGDWENDPENASKVVDENGEPMVVYHGSPNSFNTFSNAKNTQGTWTYNGETILYDTNNTFFFSTDLATAKSYDLLKRGYSAGQIQATGIGTIRDLIDIKKKVHNGLKNIVLSNAEYELLRRILNEAPLIRAAKTARNEFKSAVTNYNSKSGFSRDNSYAESLKLEDGEIKIDKWEGFNSVKVTIPSELQSFATSYISALLDAEIADYSKESTDWDGNKVSSVDIYEGVYPVFLNVRNPFLFDYEGASINAKYKDKYQIQYINARQVAKAVKDGYDGVVYKNIRDPYLANSYGVFKPEQIKSAESNVGTYKGDNIYAEGETVSSLASLDSRIQLEDGEAHRELEMSEAVNLLADTDYYPIVKALLARGKFPKDLKIELVSPIEYFSRAVIIRGKFGGKRAYYDAAEKTIKIDVTAKYNSGNVASVLMHELLHAATVDRVLTNEKARKEFSEILRQYKNATGDSTKYMDSHALEEFIADIWSNQETIENLKKYRYEGEINETLWQKIINFIKSHLFDGGVDNSLFKKASTELSSLLASSIQGESGEVFHENETQDRVAKVQKFLADQQRFYNEIKAIQDSGRLSNKEVREVAADVAYAVSDLITQVQNGEVDINELVPGKTTDKPISEMSRAEILSFIGVYTPATETAEDTGAFSYVRRKYFGNLSNIKGEGKQWVANRKAAVTINQNFRAIVELAAEEFVNVEGFGLRVVEGRPVEIVEGMNINVDDFNMYEDANEILEREGDLQEHWQVNFRTVDVLGSMSQIVRQALLQCYKLDRDGNPLESRFGIKARVSAREATSQILRWTQGAIDMQSMIKKLQEHSTSNPWINQIINRLDRGTKSDAEYGADTDFRSQFYNVFCKHFQLYTSIIEDANGKFYSAPSNEHPALRDFLTQQQAAIAMDQVPMFQGGRISEEVLAIFKGYVDALPSKNAAQFEEMTADEIEDAQDVLWAAMKELGALTTADQIAENWTYDNYRAIQSALSHIAKTLSDHAKDETYDPFEFKGGIKGNLTIAIGALITNLEDVAVSSFYDNGKTYQSYVTPSYLTKFMQKMRLQGTEFDTFIENEFGQYDLFKMGDEWRNPWLKAIVELGDKGYKCGNIPYGELLAHKVELNFDKHGYMREMTPAEYSLSLIAEYFSAAQGTGKESVLPAWYRVPMLSNKPSSEFIRFRRYADQATYKENVVNDLMMVFAQELSRIKTTKARNERYKKGSLEYIKNLDKNGSKFNFLPYLNDTSNSRFNSLIEQKTDPHGEALTIEEEAELNTLAREEITKYLSRRADEIISRWANNGVMESAVKISGIDKNNVRNQLENFIWNDHLATIMIEELFVTDIALYKNTEDLQKRMAQIHAPGVRGDVTAVDYDGKRVSDGTYRTVLLKDFDTFKSNVIDNIREVFERREKGLEGAELAAAQALHKAILKQYGALVDEGEDGINVADAQGYSCFTSRRKKDFIMGLWSREKEAAYKAYKRITEGNYTNDDLASIFNLTKISDACEPEKPFCYSQIKKSTNVTGCMSNYKLGVQYKNSEYLLIMADAILQHEKTSRANLLRAINTFMEESAAQNDGKGIDTVQFESTAKALNQGAIDISKYQYEVGGEAAALLELQRAAYTDETMSAYNLSVVHEVPFEDWCIQQPVPNHFYDHAQAQGSQGRMIIPSDLATMYNGEEVKFQVYDREYTSQEFRKEYETNISENIKKSIEELQNELGLEGKNRRERNIAIAEILQREIKSSSRYGTDLLRACTLDENGEFIIPLSDPIQSKRIEQLLNSIIKNRVNKQEIAGGPVVQVSNFGTSQDLNIRFKDKRGGLLMTKAEFAKEAKANHLTDAAVEKAYKDYVAENQGGIAYYEIFAPRFDGIELYEDKFGNVDIARIERECPELLDIIAYRIPTEDKYSLAPCKIVGFLPKYAGAGIMMPADITRQTGCDFDIDKMYVMRKEFIRQKGTKGEKLFFPHDDTTIGRNNKTVEMYKAVLTHESNADKILNPGGFEPQKRVGYMVQAYKNNPNMTWEELTAIANGKTIEVNGEKLKGTDALKALSYKSSDLGFVDTQIQFYEQNSAASSILAIFAVAKVAHATLEGNKFRVALNNVGTDGVGMRYPITIGDFTLGTKGDMTAEIDPTFNIKNEYINKALGSLVASAADAVKDPVLNLMNINKETVNVLNTLVRLGMTFEQAALFLSQKTISDLMQEYYKTRLSEGTTLQKVLSDRLSKFKEMGDADEVVLTEKDLVDGLRSSGKALKVYQTLFAFDKVMRIHNALQGMNFVTRYNSISNAVGPLIIDNIMKENKGQATSFTQILKTLDNGAYSNNEVLGELYAKHPILFQFQRTLGVAQQLFADMPEYNNLFAQALNVKHDIGFDRTILKNRDVLNKYADFFKSYMLVASGVIDKGELNYYVNDFAKEFLKIKQDEKYLDNQFVQAIRVAKDKVGSLYLKVDSGVLNDQTLKGDLSASWADLLTLDKDLAIKLFKYCFFRGGIGFTPRTFMQLVPLELKQAIDGYVDTYRSSTIRQFPLNDFARIFAQNNWRDYRIVPERKLTDPNPKIGNKFIPHDNGIIEMLASQSNSPYMKWKDEENVYHLYELLPMSDESTSYYQEIPILGGNGEYLEFGIGRDYQPIQKVATTTDNNTTITENETLADTNELLGGEDVARLDIETADFVSEFSHNEEQATEAKIVEGFDNLGIAPTFKNTLGQAVYDAVHEKTPDVTKEAIDKTIDEKNIC